MNVYYNPEKFGLRIVGQMSWCDDAYQFDMTVVWENTATGVLYFDSDSGCSCPSPFEDTALGDLLVLESPQQLIDFTGARLLAMSPGPDLGVAAARAGELIQKVRTVMAGDL